VPRSLNLKNYPTPLIGIDEVGRGCLAGPVVAGAVIFKSQKDIQHYIDSKKLKEEQRTELSASIHEHHYVGIGWASVEEIDQINILQATFLAMRRAIEKLESQFMRDSEFLGTLLIDGRDRVPKMDLFHQVSIIKGDQKVSLISAASIAAKVARDQFMIELSQSGAQYGFEKHKGYGTLFHRQQIQKLGPGSWHRQTFGGVKEYLAKQSV
jgi:ribonuclease HII